MDILRPRSVYVNDGETGRERKLSRTKPKKSKATRPERSRGRRVLVFAAILVIFLAVVGYVISQPPRQAAGIGEIAPDFTLSVVTATGLTDQNITLSSFRGRVVFLEFMVSSCPVCQQMAPSLEYLSQKYQGQDVVFLSVAGTLNGGTAKSTADFIREYQSTWTYVLDADRSVFLEYRVGATPTFLIIDRSGEILSRLQGTISTDALSSAIDHALS
jgi:thiol-disulfide isomerase/thioredoxin